MFFKCEENSFLKHFSTKVVSCERATMKWTPPYELKQKEIKGFDVILEDTILFPAGGGQPCDYGYIENFPVRRVVRKDNQAVHFVETDQELEVGSEVKQSLDWCRRLDHMQHHSGQHLLTALFSRELNYETTSWWLGSDTAYVELDTPHFISRESLDLIENVANTLIRAGCPVTIEHVDPDDVKALEGVRVRNLPKNHTGLVRLVNIEGLEKNACCGTHVTNIGQLQCAKILYAEKTKNCVTVHFLFGDRIMKRLAQCLRREQELNSVLNGGPDQHVQLVKKLQNDLRTKTKSLEKVLKDLAIAEAEKVDKLRKTHPKYYCLHRKDGIEPSFINTFLRHAPEDLFYFLTVSENEPYDSKGHMVLRGYPAAIEKLGPLFLDILEGKGSACEGNFQGKFNLSSKIHVCDAMLDDYFNMPN